MSVVRPISQVIDTLEAVTPTFTAKGTQYDILGLAPDRTLWGVDKTNLRLVRSTNDTTSWATLCNYVFPAAPTAFGVLASGEVVVTITGTAQVYVSTGWPANPTTATFTKVLDVARSTVGFASTYGGLSVYGNKILVTEYGPQTSGGLATAATKQYLSKDGGATWKTTIDLAATTTIVNGGAQPWLASTANAMHTHGGAIDPYWDAIWVCFGDGGIGNSSGYSGVMFSADEGATWTSVTLSADSSYQSVMPFVTEDAIFLLSDGTPNGVYRIGRAAYRQATTIESVCILGTNPAAIIGTRISRAPFGSSPILCAATGTTSTAVGFIFYSSDGGFTWEQAYRDANTVAGGAQYVGLQGVWGPTNTGKIVGTMSDTTRFASGAFLVADVPRMPAAVRDAGGTASVADAGTIAHGLGLVPQRATVTPTVAGHIAAVTAVDGTNITVSLTVASTGAAVAVAENVRWTAGA